MINEDSPGVRALRASGYKLTTPRLTILNILEKSAGHLTAAELLTRVEEHDSSIGRASVFRTLDLMIKLGIIWTSVQGGSTVHYMLMPGGTTTTSSAHTLRQANRIRQLPPGRTDRRTGGEIRGARRGHCWTIWRLQGLPVCGRASCRVSLPMSVV
jgi:Fe2+ or Zn2+ uptake regulation protein